MALQHAYTDAETALDALAQKEGMPPYLERLPFNLIVGFRLSHLTYGSEVYQGFETRLHGSVGDPSNATRVPVVRVRRSDTPRMLPGARPSPVGGGVFLRDFRPLKGPYGLFHGEPGPVDGSRRFDLGDDNVVHFLLTEGAIRELDGTRHQSQSAGLPKPVRSKLRSYAYDLALEELILS